MKLYVGNMSFDTTEDPSLAQRFVNCVNKAKTKAYGKEQKTVDVTTQETLK